MQGGGAILALSLILCACAPRTAENLLPDQPGPVGGSDDPVRILLDSTDQHIVALGGGEDREIVSLLRISKPMRFGESHWDEAGVPVAPTWIRIDLARQTMSVFRGGHEIGTGVILYGADTYPTPRGRFPVLAKLKDHWSSIYDAEMPYTLRLTSDGVAIHGSNVRRGAATHGCIGIPEAFAAHVFQSVQPGDLVFIS
jgi:hypothetical protein